MDSATLFKKILIRMPNWLGDAVMATPILEDIRHAYPDAHITILCHEAIGSLLQQNPFADDFILFSKDIKKDPKQLRELFARLRASSFDIGLLLTNSFSSAWWFFRSGIKKRIGYRTHYRRLLLTQSLPLPHNEETQHQVLTYKTLLSALNIPLSSSAPKLFVTQKEIAQAHTFLHTYGISSQHTIIGINPSAAYGEAKCWPIDRFQQLCTYLLKHPDLHILCFGDASSKQLISTLTSGMQNRVHNLAAATSLRELLALISQCRCLVTNDSGPMHIAAALQVPLVALFGSTNEIKTGPYGYKGSVIHKHVACSPCYLRKCPIDFRCMTQITVGEVAAQVEKILHKQSQSCHSNNSLPLIN